MKPTIIVRYYGSEIAARFFGEQDQFKKLGKHLEARDKKPESTIAKVIALHIDYLQKNFFSDRSSVIKEILHPSVPDGKTFLERASEHFQIYIELTIESLRW
ncbi:MAG: hypothetical protein WCO09_00235 [bacterium]